jgi:predicted DNA-binding transcriptional regulator AlpA
MGSRCIGYQSYSIGELRKRCSIQRRSFPNCTRYLTTIGGQRKHLRKSQTSTWSILGSIPRRLGSRCIGFQSYSIGEHHKSCSIQRRSFPRSTRYLTTIGGQRKHLRKIQTSTWSILGSIPRRLGSRYIGFQSSSIGGHLNRYNIR